ncbi:uncharacterized protein LOC143224350 [Tachypleus tridentatus]|uniref:uncharacterized protein LOC143224350 n=1 Tax=Tachypleus tridentatus TaxID=6853 RepID=UPI003FD00ACA
MKFAIPRIWREPIDHSSNCYFCMVDPSKCWAGKNASALTYLDLPSSITPVPHCPELPVPTPLERKHPSSEEEVHVEDPDYNLRGAAGEINPYYPNQRDLNNLIRDFGLTKLNAEFLTSRLHEDILDVECCYQGAYKKKMMEDYIWRLIHESNLHYSHKSQKITRF